MCACLPEMKEGCEWDSSDYTDPTGTKANDVRGNGKRKSNSSMSAFSKEGETHRGHKCSCAWRYVTVSFPRGRQRPSFSPPSLSISLPSEWLQISRGSSVFPFPSLKRRLGPDSMENNCLQCCLEKLLEIPFLFCDMSKLSIFQLFLSVGNLTPEHKCFFLAKLKSPLFQLNRAPDRRTQTDTCGGHAILCLGPLSLNSPKGFSTFCAWNFHFVTD